HRLTLVAILDPLYPAVLDYFPTRRSSDLTALREAACRDLVPEEDVLGDREPINDIELLVHGGNAEIDRRLRVGDGNLYTLPGDRDRKSTRLNSSHVKISYAVFCLKKKKHR